MTLRTKPTDHITDTGPFDIIGDVHGCFDELNALLEKLGYYDKIQYRDRKLIFVGDYVDRGPKSGAVLALASDYVWGIEGEGYGVIGNHDNKFMRYLMGRDVKISHGLDVTIKETQAWSDYYKGEALRFLQGLPHHLVLDNGNLVVAHAGLEERFHGADHKAVEAFCLYGKTTGEHDEFGLPVRLHWEDDYTGKATVVYGHTPYREVQVKNNTYNIDTGCVFGNKLTCLRYPEMEIVQVDAKTQYSVPNKPLGD